ncbi:MAG TPA: PQQ-dependent sugar dehydrogenase [Thermomicrobiales bacterium]|nr:PQQ-dependent sugar dehydrogenase [Thermomicrobiales bacterium]
MRALSIRTLVAGALVALLIPALSAFALRPAGAQGECQLFEETGFEVCGELLTFWNETGGLPIYGYPLTAAAEELNPDTGQVHTVQYFERERLELHPTNEPPYNVLLGRLGVQILEMNGLDWTTFEKMSPDSEHYFEETGFAIAPEFWDYWSSHGLEYGDPGVSFRESLLLFGYPISAPQTETNPDGDTVLTQWFERARFEYHPDNEPPFDVLLGRLGAEYLALVDDGDGEPEGVAAELVADVLAAPLMVTEAPDDSGRLYIVDQVGQIWVLLPDGSMAEQPFLDIGDRLVDLNPNYDERGLLGLAFHPNYAENGRFFVYYSAPLREGAPDDWNHTNVLAEFHVSDDPLVADPNSERELLALDWPAGNHNGGTVAFGPHDGYLYLSLGDGGGGNDVGTGHVEDWYDVNEGGNGQDIEQNLMGTIIRLDVDAGEPYGIPADNPFVEGPGLDEIYAYGFRNPYRFAFDPGGDHRLFAGDAGQELWEEVSVVELGGNYGWNVYEGTHCFSTADPEVSLDECPTVVGEDHPDAGAPLRMPVLEFLNAKQEGGLGLTIVGGHVYRAGEIPGFDGRYIFGAWSAGRDAANERLPGRVFIATEAPEGLWDFEELVFSNMEGGNLGHFVLGFGQDNAGNVYVTTTDVAGPAGNSGRVYRIAPAS